MRRARIKAAVTVPARRKGIQEAPRVVNVKDSEGRETETEECSEIRETNLQNSFVQEPLQEIPPSEVLEQETPKQTEIDADSNKLEANVNCSPVHTSPSKDAVQVVQTQLHATALADENSVKNEIHNKTSGSTPSKTPQSRSCFTKPAPRLDGGTRIRQNGIQGSGASASESEDDTRRVTTATNNRVRNDSVSSVQSTKEIPINANQNHNAPKDKMIPKRRMLISESARKLAEARREFLLKHENKTPDRSKLTMYDLIYYNPVTNPMKKSSESRLARKISVCQSEDSQGEENEDDPASAMPVPQVKVGPDGQLIIDEQSLVIEQTHMKRSREVLSKEAIIDDDNTGSGFYKRRQKSKEWSKWETLKFYKALNTVGTDFLLMQTLFPKRTRQEIKIKFKKEEKVNRHLIEKALAYHQEFDMDMLEKSLATFENTEREYTTGQESKENKKKAKSERKRKSRIVATSIGEVDASEDEDHPNVENRSEGETEQRENDWEEPVEKAMKRPQKRAREEKDEVDEVDEMDELDTLVNIDEGDCLSSGSHSDTDSEVYHVRPTRSGRQPKAKKLRAPDVNTLDSCTAPDATADEDSLTLQKDREDLLQVLEKECNATVKVVQPEENAETIKTVIPDMTQVEPGSLVILSKESAEQPGKSVLQVYMVSSNIKTAADQMKPDITPIDLSPELLATVTTRLSDVEPIHMKQECD